MNQFHRNRLFFSFLYWTLGGFVWILAEGCTQPPSSKACVQDDTCEQGQICISGLCQAGCQRHDQCPTGQFCKEGSCTALVCQPGSKQECYEGTSETKGKGTCQSGARWCHESGSGWSPCYEQRLPTAEICDTEDNDCNGQVDENIKCDCTPGEVRHCFSGQDSQRQIGTCRTGRQYCTTDRKWGPCLGQTLPSRELCDGLDNDCNGQIDDQIDCTCKPGATRSCYSGPEGTENQGTCKKGQQTCSTKGLWGACLGQQLPIPEEEDPCNNRDDDCDGKVDNVHKTQEPLKVLCYSNAPEALRNGPCIQEFRTCTGGAWSTCKVVPTAEQCNGIDDDCNGKIDDNIPPQPCASEKGGCQRQTDGTYLCKGICSPGTAACTDGKWGACTGEVTPEAQETCGNGKDDDCNGQIDDNCTCKAGETRPCYTGAQDTRQRGQCKDGTQRCNGNIWGTCEGEILPQTESCNGQDDDCDGTIDNITDPPCTIPGQTGICAKGVWSCENQQKVCKPVTKTTEVCNGQDDDCDGQIDNIADLGQPCKDPLATGPCVDGKWVCDKQQKICKPNYTPQAETCNGIDDDCDGKIDNIPGACVVSGAVGVCTAGTWSCNNNQKECTSTATPTAEVCNGLDDNCDGFIDNIPDLGQPCDDPSRQGPCKPGLWTCENQKKICKAIQLPQAEICNGKDDDCDGTIDNVAGCNKCQSNTDCPTGRLCYQGYCIAAQCLTSNDCQGGKICKQFQCTYCTDAFDCPSQSYCDTTQTPALCKPRGCQTNSDCRFGLRCNQTTRLCEPCQQSSDCPTNAVCENTLCYSICNQDSDCPTSSACIKLTRNGTATQRCYPTCQTNADCPQGFGCSKNICTVNTVLSNGAYHWSDGTFAQSCTGYRHPNDGYFPSQINGAYWITPDPQNQPNLKIKVYCDLQTHEGGWMLLARYTTRLKLKDYDPTKHQLQDAQAGQSSATPTELTNITLYGHLAYNTFPIAGRELMMRCRDINQTTWQTTTRFNLWNDWSTGIKGVAGQGTWGILASPTVSRKDTGICGQTASSGASEQRGLAYCEGSASDWTSHLASFAFDPTTGKTSIGCGGQELTDGVGEIWVRDWGKNPIVTDLSGVRIWKDGSMPPTCQEYKASIGGQYTGATGSGTYWLQPDGQTQLQAYCDMTTDMNQKTGGWTLFARYKQSLFLRIYDPFVHQVQTSSGGAPRTTPPSIHDATDYGHIKYDIFPIAGREIRMMCQFTENGVLKRENVSMSLFKTWRYGSTSSVIGSDFTTLVGRIFPAQSPVKGFYHICYPRNDTPLAGIGYCKGSRDPMFLIQFTLSGAHDTTIYCNNRTSPMQDATKPELHIYLR